MWGMFSAILRPGVELRLLEERHAPVLFALVERDREYLRQWMPWVDTRSSEDDILEFIRRALGHFAANNGFNAGIWVDGSIAGVIGLHTIDWMNRRGEIGYWLGREFQGCGIMTDAVRAVTQHGLVEMELNRIEILCSVVNAKSSAVPKRLGFSFEGILREAQRLNERYVDLEIYSMLRREYRRP
jgi:ribosomal-protein-serine acetyltransferase